MTHTPPPAFDDRQLETYRVLQRNLMAWVVFIYVAVFFAIGFFVLIYAVFRPVTEVWMKAFLALVDSFLVWSLKHIITYLFPTPPGKR